LFLVESWKYLLLAARWDQWSHESTARLTSDLLLSGPRLGSGSDLLCLGDYSFQNPTLELRHGL
jgi:hypothetical protein